MTTQDQRKNVEAGGNQAAPRTFWLLGLHMTVHANHDDTGGRYDLIEGRKQPGDQTPLHRHTRYIEQLFVLEGEVTIWIEQRRLVLHAGESALIPIGAAHVVGGSGDGPARALVIASPSGFARLVEEAGVPDDGDDAPRVATETDLARVRQIATALGDEILGPTGALPAG